jgi:GAF domain-containing protein/HAMP domain-containing protein
MSEPEAREPDRRSRSTRRWRIAHKLTAASTLMILLILVTAGVGLWQVLTIGQAIDDALEKEQQRAWSLELLASGRRLVADLEKMVLTEDPLLASTEVAASLGTLTFYVGSLQETLPGGALGALGEMRAAYDQLRQAVDEVDVQARQEHWMEAGRVLEQRIRPANEGMELLIQQLVQQADQDVETTALGVRTAVQRAVLLLGSMAVLTTAIALCWRQFVFRGLGQSITELRQGVVRISRGDLRHRLKIRTGDEVEELGVEFNKMAEDLADLVSSLEQRVVARTRDLEHRSVQLEAANQVAREAAAIRDVNRLLEEVVHLISDRFAFYHAGIFLVDEAGEYAVLRAASSEGGQRMLARGHALKVGKVGVVGYAAGRGEPRIALAVSADKYHYKNPDLPLTQSEVALPLKVRERVIGVLDVQSQEEMAFDTEDVAVLQTLADQVALAIESARLLEESQRALQELESLFGRRLREAWREREIDQTAYRYSRTGVTPAPRSQAPEMEDATAHDLPIVVQGGDGNHLVVPISLRDQILGSVVLRREPGQEPWSPQDLLMVEEVGAQIAMALEYARLLEDTQRSAARERLLGEITARMRETLDVDTVLRTAIREMGTALGIPRVEVRMATGGNPGQARTRVRE